MALLMNVVFSTMITASGGNSYPMQSTTTSFETYDDLGCETTAKLLLGTGANLNQGKWYLKKGSVEQTVICFPKAGDQKPEVNRGIQQ
jgi:hypothetical protein